MSPGGHAYWPLASGPVRHPGRGGRVYETNTISPSVRSKYEIYENFRAMAAWITVRVVLFMVPSVRDRMEARWLPLAHDEWGWESRPV